MNKMIKINKSAVKNMINNGWSIDILYCGSKQTPDKNPEILMNSISSGFFRNLVQFDIWCNKVKGRICSEVSGSTLKFYVSNCHVLSSTFHKNNSFCSLKTILK